MKLKIENKFIGENEPCFIVAEAGINHNGNISLAKKLIKEAKKCGADAVKFQTFKTENFVSEKDDPKSFRMFKKLELKENEYKELFNFAKKINIIFFSTPGDEESANFLEKLGVPLFKIGSDDLTNLPFLKYVAKFNKPMIVSTGMADLKEVKDAVSSIYSTGNKKVVLLHCITSYPAKEEDINLKAIKTMQKNFFIPIGYSDHTLGINTCFGAVALGAKVIEKHFTLDKKLKGPDHKLSANPKEFKELVSGIRDLEKSFGSGIKIPTKSEKQMRVIARKSIYANKDIKKGEVIKKEMLILKRPAKGMLPKYFDIIIGKNAKRNIKEGELITLNKIKGIEKMREN